MHGNNNDQEEVYLAMIGDCESGESGEGCQSCGKSKPLVFSLTGAVLHRPEQVKSIQGMEGRRIGPDGPTGKVLKLLLLDAGLSSEKLYIIREVLHEPSEIDAICRVSNLVGEGDSV